VVLTGAEDRGAADNLESTVAGSVRRRRWRPVAGGGSGRRRWAAAQQGAGAREGLGVPAFYRRGPQVPHARTPRSMTSGGAASGWQPGRAPMGFGGPGRRGRGRIGLGRRPGPIR
jgi:hypothetical protein